MNEKDHERIWLEPMAPVYGCEGRQWCQDKVWPEDDNQGEPTEYIRADLAAITAYEAAKGGGEAVAVKALEWIEHASSFPSPVWSAQTPFGFYEIEEEAASDAPRYRFEWHSYSFICDEESLDEAKAAAQADYETRIRSALLAASPTAPALPQDVVRLVIAARDVAYSDPTPETMQELDKASEAFAERVPWEDEPDHEEDGPSAPAAGEVKP